MSTLETEMLRSIRAGIDTHNRSCPMPAKAILLNPGNYELFGWDELWGLPVLAHRRVEPKRFQIDCDGSAFGIEDELEEFLSIEASGQVDNIAII